MPSLIEHLNRLLLPGLQSSKTKNCDALVIYALCSQSIGDTNSSL